MGTKLSDIKFPDFVTGIKNYNGDWVKGGYDFQTYDTDTGFNRRKFLINELIEFDIGSYVIPSTDYMIETSVIKFFEFPNGYYMGVKFYQQHPVGQTSPAGFSFNMYDENDNPVGNIPNIFTASGSINASVPSDASILGLRFYATLDTIYYPTQDPAAGTANLGLCFYFFVGWPDNGFFVPLGNYIWRQTAVYTPGYYTGGAVGVWSDLEGFVDYLHNHGRPFSGDIFTDVPFPPDPAGSDDPSEPGGGGGNYDDTSDPIDFPALPTGGALECGAVVAHRVSQQTLEAIMLKLWDDSIFNIGNMWQKSIQDPMNAIVSLHCLPISPTVDGPTDIWIGNFDTELTSPEVTSQYIAVDCGTLAIQEYWGSALDYSPYTKFEIYLPFIGVKELRVEDAMNSTLHVKYHIDVLTGDCVAFIKCGLSVLYHFKGNCKMSVPLTSISSDIVSKLMGAAGGVVGAAGIAVGGGFAAGAMLSATGMGISSASNVASTKIPVSRSGSIEGNAGLMDDFVPYVIIHRPVQSLAKDYNKFKGFPSNITATLGSVSGYTEVEHIHLQNIPNATREEIDEIVALLKQGAIF